MPTFNIAAVVTVSCWTTVEAESEAEALSIAKKREMAQFHIDASCPVEEFWHMDADGLPDEVRVDQD